MNMRKLGKNGDSVSVIGFGAWPIGGGMGIVEEKDAIDTVHAAIDSGITLIDTAQAYRTSEAIIGKALRGGKRAGVFLATKASFDFSRQGVRSAIEESLRSLKTDYVDLYQLHSYRSDPPMEESLEELSKMQQEGKLRFIGVSNYSAENMEQALKTARIESNQPRYNLFDREIERVDIPFCRRETVGILAHSVFAKGLLTGKYRPDHVFPESDERSRMPRFQGDEFRSYLEKARRLAELGKELGISLVQFAIAWVLRDPVVTCALAGAKSVNQVEEQAKAAEISLAPDVWEKVDNILSGE